MSISSVRLAGIAHESLVNGPGLRRVFFAQGCRHGCKGCFNPETHDFGGGELKNIDFLVEDIKRNPMLKGVTFSGGDPFEQAKAFAIIADAVKKLGLNVWCYTGYTFEYILSSMNNDNGWNSLLSSIDVLVDGRFDKKKIDSQLKYRGSKNQRIIDIKESLKLGRAVILEL